MLSCRDEICERLVGKYLLSAYYLGQHGVGSLCYYRLIMGCMHGVEVAVSTPSVMPVTSRSCEPCYSSMLV